MNSDNCMLKHKLPESENNKLRLKTKIKQKLECNILVKDAITVSYRTVLYSTVLYCTVLYCTVLYCTVLYCTVL